MEFWWLSWNILAGMIADNTPLWPGVHCRRVVPFGPTRSIGWSRQAQELRTFGFFTLSINKHCMIYIAYAIGAVAWVYLVINYFYCLIISIMHSWHEGLLKTKINQT